MSHLLCNQYYLPLIIIQPLFLLAPIIVDLIADFIIVEPAS
jgi:hypothetical protein